MFKGPGIVMYLFSLTLSHKKRGLSDSISASFLSISHMRSSVLPSLLLGEEFSMENERIYQFTCLYLPNIPSIPSLWRHLSYRGFRISHCKPRAQNRFLDRVSDDA